LAAAGYDCVSVVKRPRVAIIATGDKVIAPGRPLQAGKLYASNLVTLAAWCAHYGIKTTACAGVSSDKDEKPPARDGPDGGHRDDPGGQRAHFGGENDARAGLGQVQCSLAKK